MLEAGGHMLQKDLIASTGMSHAKTARTLDRLEVHGVVARERHGATNMIGLRTGAADGRG